MASRPRTVITTDPELDDLNSMLRLLLYSNEIDIVGLVYSSSRFHFSGGAGRASHRWPAAGSVFHIDAAIDAYESAYPNLVRHDPRYPAPEYLRGITAWGNVADVGDMSGDTAGSDLVRHLLLDDLPGPLFLQVWGGHNTIARALISIEDEFRDTPGWGELHARICAKAVVTSFGKQDSTFDDYLRPHWPAIESREVATTVWGYFAREVVADEDRRFLGPEWTRENITAAGPIGAAYRVWGDGLQMAEGFDDEDYFGLSGLSAGELAERGYTVWMPPQERGGFISEGDSSNFALLVDNGLRSWEHPGWGGWGGRQGPVPGDPAGWSNEEATDAGPDGRPRKDWSAARWAGEFHQDFAARLRWSTSSEFAAANHHPCVAVVEGTMLTAQPGATVRLTAEVSDPDGDAVGVTWWQYLEAGTSRAVLDLRADLTSVEFEIPADATPGETLHLICSATDTGAPPLTRHQRVVLTVVATQA